MGRSAIVLAMKITAIALLAVFTAMNAQAAHEIITMPGQAPVGYVEIAGVAAGDFDETIWREGAFHLLPDYRHPLLEPRWSGNYRNIYAPSIIPTDDGWRVFYGAWDGVDDGNDCIYAVDTEDFLTFGERRTVIDHGPFIHICNVNVAQHPDGGYAMACTAYPVGDDTNKPVYFTSPDGTSWNGDATHVAGEDDLIALEGYDPFTQADINGMNALLHDGDALRLYFNDFKNFGQTFRATQMADKRFQFDGPVLKAPYVVNDVKRFETANGPVYLMGLHMNREGLWYALSRDGMRFDDPMPLLTHQDAADRYIVALGWVVRDGRILGVLYGAGAVPQLNRNRIFARWLQHKVVFTTEDGTRHEGTMALGPDRQLLPLPEGKHMGTLEVYAADGTTTVWESDSVALQSGAMYRLNQND
jgi:hypothetical protein